MLKKPLQTSIAVETDEFDDIDVEDKLHIVISVKDFRAIIQHAGNTGNDISARYDLPAKPIQLAYAGDAISCEFLIMTVGERGSNPAQKIKKGRKNALQNRGPQLEATSRRTSVAPSEAPQPPPWPRPQYNPTPQLSAAKTSVSRRGVFDLRPSQRPAPAPTMRSESLFVEDEGWEPVRDEEEEENARLEWDHSADLVSPRLDTTCYAKLTLKNPSIMHLNRVEDRQATDPERPQAADAEASFLEPTQRLADVRGLALFPD